MRSSHPPNEVLAVKDKGANSTIALQSMSWKGQMALGVSPSRSAFGTPNQEVQSPFAPSNEKGVRPVMPLGLRSRTCATSQGGTRLPDLCTHPDAKPSTTADWAAVTQVRSARTTWPWICWSLARELGLEPYGNLLPCWLRSSANNSAPGDALFRQRSR